MPRAVAPALLASALLLLAACGDGAPETAAPPPASAATAAPLPTAGELPTSPPMVPEASPAPPAVGSAAGRNGDEPVVVFLGDSLTAGLGLGAEQAFPSLVAAALAERGLPVRMVNAGVSGDTSAGGLRRVDWLLRQKPDVVVVALGANDALRGQPVAGIEANLREIVQRSRRAGAQVLLAGIMVPPSYGSEYAQSFAGLYRRLAEELDVPLVPFLLEGVAGDPALNLPDGIHPNEEGHRRVAALVTEHLEPLVRAESAEPAAVAAR